MPSSTISASARKHPSPRRASVGVQGWFTCRRIAEFTRVCAYDRANNGQSDEVGLHSGDQSVSDLEKLLAAKKIKPPYVSVREDPRGCRARE
jgi:hypothetical protein